MTKLPKIGGQRLSGVTESNNIQVKGKSESSKKEKKRFVRRVGKRGTEDLGAKENVVPEVSTPDVLLEESPADEFFSPDMSGWDMSDASTALDRLHMSDQQRKQLEIATNLEMIYQRVRQVLENGGVSPDLNMDAVEFNRPPAYMEENTEIDKFKNAVDEMLHLLHKQEVTKSAIIRDVDEFFGFASDDQSEPLCKAFENIEIDEKMAHEGVEQVGEAFRYTEELTDKIQVCWLRAMREAGFIDTSSDEEEGEEGGVNVQGIKGAKEMKMFSNPATFGINTNMLIKSLEEMIRLVKGRSKKDQVKQLVKQYKAQVKVTELWLDDLGKHNEENASLNQQVKELKKSRDQANKAKEELDLKKRFFERKKNEMEKENQLLKATNEKLSTRNRKLETDVSRLQDKLDSVEDEAMIAKEFGGRKTDEDDRKAAGSRVPDEATKQYIQNLKSEIANLEQVIAANNSKVTALEKELITERGNIARLKHELSLASRASAVSPSKEEEDKRKNSAVQTSNTTETNMTDDSKISEIKDDFQKAKLEINELKMELDRKTMEIQNLEKQTKELRKELMSVFDVGGDENMTPEPPPASEEEGETDAIPKNPVQNQTSTEQKKMVPASQLASLRRVMRAMTVDHQTEIKKLITHLENEKSRTEASLRKQEQSHKEQLLNVHKQAVHLLRMINRFKLAISSVLEKEMVMTAADNVRKIPDLNTEEVPADTKEMLNLMAAQASSVFMGIENNIHQAFLSIRLENKDKISANQVIQHNLKNQALQANKQLKGIEHMMEQLKDANDQLHTVKEAFVTHKKQEEIRYQSLYQRYMKLWHKYGVAQKDMDQFQRDFVEALCMKERELDDTRISQKEAQRLYQEQKKLANQLQHKISSKLEYWDEHVCLCAENMRDNLKILHKALKENKISLMVHNLTVGLIKMMMEIPLLRLRSIFKRYIRMRHFQAAKEQMEHELKGLPDDAEHKEIANDYMRYLSRVDMRLDRRVKLWQGEMVKLEDMRRSGWKEFTDVWDGHFKGTDFTSLTEEDLFLFAMGMDRGDLFTPSPVPPSRKRKRETDSELKHKLKGIRLPRLESGVNLVGEGMPLQGERQDMWKVKASRVKKPDTEEEDDEFKAAITTPKLTELENTQHLRSAQKTLKKQTATRRYLMSLQPSEPYDFQHQMPRPINKSFIDNVFHMDPDVDMFTLTDESSVKSTLTPRNTETANSVAEEGYSPRMTVKIRKYNLGTELGR